MDRSNKETELIWMYWPIVPEYRNGTTSIKRPAFNQSAIGDATTGRLRRVHLVPFYISAQHWGRINARTELGIVGGPLSGQPFL